MRIQTICGQFASKMADCSPSGHSSRSSCEQGGDGETVEQGSFAQRWGGGALSEPPPFSGSASCTRMIGFFNSSDERISRRQFWGVGGAVG